MKRLAVVLLLLVEGCVPIDPFAGQSTCAAFCNANGCDSDCDGWLDQTELNIGSNPCDAFDPQICPSSNVVARVCSIIVGCDSLNVPDTLPETKWERVVRLCDPIQGVDGTESLVLIVESAWLDGVSRSDAISIVIQACNALTPEPRNCINCDLAVIDFVYP